MGWHQRATLRVSNGNITLHCGHTTDTRKQSTTTTIQTTTQLGIVVWTSCRPTPPLGETEPGQASLLFLCSGDRLASVRIRMKRSKGAQCAKLWVESTPLIHDARELQTILTTSLRALWGQLERYSATVQVESAIDDKLQCVQCPAVHVPQVQAALTLVTPPPYLEDTLYRFDVVKIEYLNENDD